MTSEISSLFAGSMETRGAPDLVSGWIVKTFTIRYPAGYFAASARIAGYLFDLLLYRNALTDDKIRVQK